MAGFQIEPATIASGGTNLVSHADQFMSQLKSFQSEIASFEGAWGNDDIGSIIGTAYHVVCEWAMDCLAAVGEDVTSAGQDLQKMAKAFSDAEDEVTNTFRNIGQYL